METDDTISLTALQLRLRALEDHTRELTSTISRELWAVAEILRTSRRVYVSTLRTTLEYVSEEERDERYYTLLAKLDELVAADDVPATSGVM